MVFVNPVILEYSKTKSLMNESCLSIDNISGILKRHIKVIIKAYDTNCNKFVICCTGLLAQICQHEMDHLNGKFYIDKCKKVYSNPNLKLQKYSTMNYL